MHSADAMYDKLEEVVKISDCSYGTDGEFTLEACGGVDGNEEGSYLTMLSREGLIFGIINIVGNFGTVFVDQSYWQSAIAAKPQSSHKGYVLTRFRARGSPLPLTTPIRAIDRTRKPRCDLLPTTIPS